jgi:primosomal protein N' (replication factor Y)
MTYNAVLVLSSATPSVESYYNAEKGRYKLLNLPQRYNNTPLPKVNIIDMSIERDNGNTTEFSRPLQEALQTALERKEQAVILLNRRGYNSVMLCAKCKEVVYCANCTVPLTYHKKTTNMQCHYCGYTSAIPQICPKCSGATFRNMGFGTQKIEEELQSLLPCARLLRMDSDTIASRASYEQSFRAFAEGEYDIMLGTQMISKGLDFPNVTVVGVISVDKALHNGDYNSYERTFSLITQVVGRGGRADKQALAFLQTFQPDHYLLKLAASQDYEAFYKEEIAGRRAMVFPPICDICVMLFTAKEEEKARQVAEAMPQILKGLLEKYTLDAPLRVLGPVKCYYEKINSKYRYRLILKCKNTEKFRSFIREAITTARLAAVTADYITINNILD